MKWIKEHWLKVGLSIILLPVIGVIILIILIGATEPKDPYFGGYAPDGTYCDYGYNSLMKSCCDDDDYSCENCDKYGIYCDAYAIQGFDDISGFPGKSVGKDYDCSDFSFWEDAQKVFIRDGGPQSDYHKLDGDKDGIACEALK